MINFKIGKENYELPTSYAELTLGQFIRLRKSDGDVIDILSILLGIDKATLSILSDVDIDYKIIPYIEFLKEEFNVNEYLLPDYIEFKGKLYPRPKGIGLGTFGQKISLQKELANYEDDIDCFPVCLAIYMQPIVEDKLFDYERALEMVPEFEKIRLSEAFPLCSFFLLNLKRYLHRRENGLTIIQARKKLAQELKNLETSENFRHFSLWRKLLIKLLSKFLRPITTQYLLPLRMKRKPETTGIS